MRQQKIDRVLGALMRFAFAVIIGVMFVALSEAHGAEVVAGRTAHGANHWEFTYNPPSRNWRAGLTWTDNQQFTGPRGLACGSLGSAGPVCVWRRLPVDLDGYASAYVQRMWNGRHVYGGVGLSVHPVRSPLLSLPASFRLSAGWRFDKQWAIEYTHMSNAHLRTPNMGQDVLLIRYEFN